jgi:anti-sigma regulatory factor (Ser/Thr protein kinase)
MHKSDGSGGKNRPHARASPAGSNESPVASLANPNTAGAGLRHEIWLYAGIDDFVTRASAFLREGIERDEPCVVAVSREKVARLQAELGHAADAVQFVDMPEVGRNPARLIPLWLDLVDEHPGRTLRGLGEPIWAERSAAELEECHLHESLLNVAMHDAPILLVCPYDIETLNPSVIDDALHNHPVVAGDGYAHECALYVAPTHPLEGALPEPETVTDTRVVHIDELGALRRLMTERAEAFGLDDRQVYASVLAVTELATNSVRYGRGTGTFRTWQAGDALLFEVSDNGHIEDPLAGRVRPLAAQNRGRGLWITNQVCDLVQLRSSPRGTTVRVWMRRT